MILYLVGISCVGKTTIGKILSEKIGFSFFDLDIEIQKYYNKPIERIQDNCLTMNQYREKASVVLNQIFSNNENMVVSGAPSGLKYSYLNVYKRHKTDKIMYSIHLKDSFENILDRITFYDKDSNPIRLTLSELEKVKYLRKIKADYNFFKNSYKCADFEIDINDIPLTEIPSLIINELQKKCLLPTNAKTKWAYST